jgi:myo-inositol-1(or 4)-monophosphatase
VHLNGSDADGGAAVRLEPELRVTLDLVDTAVRLLRAGAARPIVRQRKGPHDVVTPLDAAVERRVMAGLSAAFPDDGRIGEETGAQPGRSGRLWLVDPLDGTINFAAGLPFFSVSVALVVRNQPVLGVVADPLRVERFIGVVGRGAWAEDASGRSGALRLRRLASVHDAVVSLDPGEPSHAGDPRLGAIRAQVRAVRTLGSTALSLAWLAAGRLDGVLQLEGLQSVDVAAGAVIATLAGARVTAATGGPWLRRGGITAGDGIAAAGRGVHRVLVSPPPHRG